MTKSERRRRKAQDVNYRRQLAAATLMMAGLEPERAGPIAADKRSQQHVLTAVRHRDEALKAARSVRDALFHISRIHVPRR